MKRIGLVILAIIVPLAWTSSPGLAQTKSELKTALKSKNLAAPEKINSAEAWWRNPAYAQTLGLTVDQQKKMDDVFQEFRIKLIDLNASLEKEEVMLEPLMQAERMDEGRILAQIDRVAQARAELEKSNARMLLGIRQVMTADQWNRLNSGMARTKLDLKPFKEKPLQIK